MSFEKVIDIKYDVKLYNIYKHTEYNNCYIIIGKTQDGNDYIISEATNILEKCFNISSTNDELIWLHGDGPSPHFILYKEDNILESIEIDIFVKSKCPKKSNKNKKLSCSLLSNVVKTDIKGLVQVKNNSLAKLLIN